MKATYEDLINFIETECPCLCMDDEDDRGVLVSTLLERFNIEYDNFDDEADEYEDYQITGPECSEEEIDDEQKAN